jgi:glycosyltransferase involved in cell wall biosynthesis
LDKVNPLSVSVIIPTYNRKHFLQDTLLSLAVQKFPFSRFEVIVVDDGSTESAQEVHTRAYPFPLHTIRQANQGDAIARNTGAEKSQADLLVFLDDDILIGEEYLAAIVAGHGDSKNRIVIGSEILWLDEQRLPALQDVGPDAQMNGSDLERIEFTAVCSNNMSILRGAYQAVGLMQNLDFPGSSMWCDLDFSYRASQKGFEFFRSKRAVCWHRDYVSKNLENQKKRWKEAAYRAVALFAKYPSLVRHLPMFEDKAPVDWRKDSPGMILRKFARQIAAAKPAMGVLEFSEKALARKQDTHPLVQSLQRWIIGGTIYRGYRQGLRDKSLLSSSFKDRDHSGLEPGVKA